MEFNATFIVQIIAFVIFVYVCMKWIWPPIMNGITERQKFIADSLNNAAKASKDVELAKENAKNIIVQAKNEAKVIIDNAQQMKANILDEATIIANEEKKKILEQTKSDIELEKSKARESLKKELSELVILSTEKILTNNISSVIDEKIVKDSLSKI
ncbi:MAG: F0F1 ATP synthase subunit B [Succinivibrionaceae bacterium]